MLYGHVFSDLYLESRNEHKGKSHIKRFTHVLECDATLPRKDIVTPDLNRNYNVSCDKVKDKAK
jgi:hypothetical protein